MRKYTMVVFSYVFILVLFFYSCSSLNVNDNIIKTNKNERELYMNEEEYDLETIEKLNSRFGGNIKIYIELTSNYEIIIHYKNETDNIYYIPYDFFYAIDTRLDSDLKVRAVIARTINIEDSYGIDLLAERKITIDKNIYHVITEDECLRMLPGDEYVSEPVSLNNMINLDLLKNTGMEIRIYYGSPENIRSNIITLLL